MQYLNAIRGAIDIAKTENKPELVLKLNKEAVKFINSFNALNMEKSQKNISKNMQTEIDNVAELLGTNGIKNAHKKLNVAKDFQNFNDEHCNIVTLSKVTNDEGKEHIVVEAEVAFKGLTDEQKQEYQNREGKNWYNVMPEWERKLVDRYADTIQNGRHVIPTQLRQIVGMKNAFEKIGAITDKDGKNFETLLTSKHAGTLASISNDIDSRQKITDLNARQAQEWLEDGFTIHTNTLNSGPIGAGNDPTIVDQTKKSMENVGGKNTNTPLNLFRLIGVTNNFSGVSDTLNKIAENLLTEKGIDELKAHIKPRSKFERFFRINKPKGNAVEIINNANLTDQEKEILKKAVTLRENIEQADIPFRISFETKLPFISFDKENINLNISDALSNLTEKIRQNKQENKTTSLINLLQ